MKQLQIRFILISAFSFLLIFTMEGRENQPVETITTIAEQLDPHSIDCLNSDSDKIVVPISTPQGLCTNNTNKITKLSWWGWIKKNLTQLKKSFVDDPGQYAFRGSLFLLGATMVFFSAPEEHASELHNFSILSTLTTFILNYLRYFTVNAAHEGGHALANRLVNGTVSEIYLGSHAQDEGIELLPHVTLVGLHPSIGGTTHENPMFSEEMLAENVKSIILKFKQQYPNLGTEERMNLPEYQQALSNARACSTHKTLKSKLQYASIMLAGVISGLITNGIFKFSSGDNPFSIDYVDLYQLFNLIPVPGSDGGMLATKVLETPSLLSVGEQVMFPVIAGSFLLKNLHDMNNNQLFENRNIASKLLHAAGLAAMNLAGYGFCHAQVTK